MNDVGRKILLNLAKRRRWAYRDYLNMKKRFHSCDSIKGKENLLIALEIWVVIRNTYFAAKEIYEEDSRSR